MQVSIEEVEGGNSLMTIEVESAQAQQIGRAVVRQASVPGFRPGKAPITTIVGSLSPEDLATTVGSVEEVQDIIQKALEESELDTSADTFLESVAWNPMILTVAVAADESEDESEDSEESEDGEE